MNKAIVEPLNVLGIAHDQAVLLAVLHRLVKQARTFLSLTALFSISGFGPLNSLLNSPIVVSSSLFLKKIYLLLRPEHRAVKVMVFEGLVYKPTRCQPFNRSCTASIFQPSPTRFIRKRRSKPVFFSLV